MSKLQFLKALLTGATLVSTLAGCGSNSSTQAPGTVSSTMTAASQGSAVQVTLPAGTVLYSDLSKTKPVTGNITVKAWNVKYTGAVPSGRAPAFNNHSSVHPMSVFGQLAGATNKVMDGTGVFANIEITNGTDYVRTLSAPISVTLKIPSSYAQPGTSVDYYSYDGGVMWTKEGSTTVKSDGSVTFNTKGLMLAVTKFVDWVPPGNGLTPQGTYSVTGSPNGMFTFVVGTKPGYAVAAKDAVEAVIPLTSASITLKSGSTTLYDFTATVISTSTVYTGTLDTTTGLITGTYSNGSVTGVWSALSGFMAYINQGLAVAGNDPVLNQLLRMQSETTGGYGGPIELSDNTLVEPTKAFDNAYYLGYKGTGCWVITNSTGDIYLIDALNGDSDGRDIIVPGLIKLGLDPARIKAVLVTHEHGDHYGAAKYLQDTYGAKVYMGRVAAAAMPASTSFNGATLIAPTVTNYFTDGETLSFGDFTITTVFTPGHSAGCFSFIFPVKDTVNGVTKTYNAAVWGGSGIPASTTSNATEPQRTKVAYVESVDYFMSYAKKANVEVIIGIHGPMDNNLYKLELCRNRKAGDANPFVIGYEQFSRYMQVLKAVCLAAIAEIL